MKYYGCYDFPIQILTLINNSYLLHLFEELPPYSCLGNKLYHHGGSESLEHVTNGFKIVKRVFKFASWVVRCLMSPKTNMN